MTRMTQPSWLDSAENGALRCDDCSYTTDDDDFLQSHIKAYHKSRHMVLYMECQGSLDGRNALIDRIGASPIDCTGGQAAFRDGDLQEFGRQVVNASAITGHKLYRILRIFDPGVGLYMPLWWVEGGLKAGVFQSYPIPSHVQADDDKGGEEIFVF